MNNAKPIDLDRPVLRHPSQRNLRRYFARQRRLQRETLIKKHGAPPRRQLFPLIPAAQPGKAAVFQRHSPAVHAAIDRLEAEADGLIHTIETRYSLDPALSRAKAAIAAVLCTRVERIYAVVSDLRKTAARWAEPAKAAA